MLTKIDLKAINQLTRSAIKDLAVTKEEAKIFTTKKDLIGLSHGSEIDNLKITFLDKIEQWKNEIINKIDPILGRVKTAEEENTVLRSREEGRQEERDALDGRIKKLESIHPNNSHIRP
ncbi:hypothetical protein A2W14_01575 [Candidatus Gottesmanbacteria bacterium RBG_16_37_8]|uniref:Uncharacterized protein n=1 Tax=Candidatus Gottesmanbacteria bacterium RBG_16_37_8 TaxID=1798371 RepID=A0A1F5YQW3_9BACT|nr:MAG: hypothetical protein A2W14_01575 [Candidatus Gottesmanbacteria bacterium RBG_16_37_8]